MKKKINRNYDKHDELLAKEHNEAVSNKMFNRDHKVAVLSFPLPDFEYDFECAQNGWKYKAVLEELQNEMRSVYKHGNNKTAEKYARIWSDRLLELVNERDLTIV